eukprot:705939-Amphidinium_carterae.1
MSSRKVVISSIVTSGFGVATCYVVVWWKGWVQKESKISAVETASTRIGVRGENIHRSGNMILAEV